MTNIAALSRLIENLIRLGTVAEVDHGSLQDKRPARVRVQSGELLTGWLPWATLRAGTTRDWDPHTVGEQVLVLSPTGLTAQGIAITGLFSALIPANGDRARLHRRTYPDGVLLEYWPPPWLTLRRWRPSFRRCSRVWTAAAGTNWPARPAQQLRRSQQQRIRSQVNPDDSPLEARKRRDLFGNKGPLRYFGQPVTCQNYIATLPPTS